MLTGAQGIAKPPGAKGSIGITGPRGDNESGGTQQPMSHSTTDP